jgi:hypothetical protein
MNCKPGDLAVVARLTNENLRPYLGRIVTCVRVVAMDCWETVPMLEPYRGVYDGALRPIRDPGEDAQDETLSWLPVPSREGAEA